MQFLVSNIKLDYKNNPRKKSDWQIEKWEGILIGRSGEGGNTLFYLPNFENNIYNSKSYSEYPAKKISLILFMMI